MVGLIMWLLMWLYTTGVICVIQHLVLRIILFWSGDIPWDYARFLDHGAKHRFIQKVGGSYGFMHDLLREYFAQMPLDLKKLKEFLKEE